MRPLSILIADDHLLFRMGLKTLIQSEPGYAILNEAKSGEECVRMYRAQRPDVVLMDLRMPGGSGIEALSTIRKSDPNARVLILTSYGTEEEIYQALQLGAMGYVLKDTSREALLEAIRSAHAGKKWVPAAIAARLAERLPRQTLSPREVEILQLLVKGLTNRDIASVLKLSQSTIKNQINLLFAKLEVTDRTEAATAGLQRGIIHLDD
jgi:DNA-binding NarL/FixJ family response regulator